MKKFIFALIFMASTITGQAIAADNNLMMATTTSTQDSGLLEYLAPIFKTETGIDLKWVAVGTGKALEHGKNCDVDTLLVHAPKAEKAFVEAGFGVDRKQVMYNDFVLVGPKDDAVKVKGMAITEALKVISIAKANFISRGDESGTHKAEQETWKAVGLAVPDKESWYVQAGQGMIATLNMAAEKNGYTLTDRGTWIKYAATQKDKNKLDIVVENDNKLFNQYSVIMPNPANCPKVKKELAGKFATWLVSPKTQKAIADYKLEGKQLFFPNADK